MDIPCSRSICPFGDKASFKVSFDAPGNFPVSSYPYAVYEGTGKVEIFGTSTTGTTRDTWCAKLYIVNGEGNTYNHFLLTADNSTDSGAERYCRVQLTCNYDGVSFATLGNVCNYNFKSGCNSELSTYITCHDYDESGSTLLTAYYSHPYGTLAAIGDNTNFCNLSDDNICQCPLDFNAKVCPAAYGSSLDLVKGLITDNQGNVIHSLFKQTGNGKGNGNAPQGLNGLNNANNKAIVARDLYLQDTTNMANRLVFVRLLEDVSDKFKHMIGNHVTNKGEILQALCNDIQELDGICPS